MAALGIVLEKALDDDQPGFPVALYEYVGGDLFEPRETIHVHIPEAFGNPFAHIGKRVMLQLDGVNWVVTNIEC